MKKHSLSTILVLIILYTVLISTVLFVLYPVAFTVGAAWGWEAESFAADFLVETAFLVAIRPSFTS